MEKSFYDEGIFFVWKNSKAYKNIIADKEKHAEKVSVVFLKNVG